MVNSRKKSYYSFLQFCKNDFVSARIFTSVSLTFCQMSSKSQRDAKSEVWVFFTFYSLKPSTVPPAHKEHWGLLFDGMLYNFETINNKIKINIYPQKWSTIHDLQRYNTQTMLRKPRLYCFNFRGLPGSLLLTLHLPRQGVGSIPGFRT